MTHSRRAAPSTALLLFLHLLLAVAPASAQYMVETLHESGPKEERVTFLLLSEGYTEAELPLFLDDARKVMGDFFAVSPFDAYRDYFNVLAVAVASNESGADHPDEGIYRDTYFQVTYRPDDRRMYMTWPDGPDRLYAIQTELGLWQWNSVVLLLVNDDQYGGAGPQGGGLAIVSRSYDRFGAAVHEIGHALGGLADEYVDGAEAAMTEDLNLTSETRREYVKWRHWFEDDTPIPTPFDDAFSERVGLFEGGGYVAEGVYRPQMICKMQSSEAPFCAVCREHLIGRVNRAYPYATTPLMLRVTTPAEDTLTVASTSALDFTLRTPMPTHGLETKWRVNGVAVDGNRLALSLDAAALGPGEHMVELSVVDETPMVRDPAILPLLTTSRTWTLLIDTAVNVEGDGLAAQAFSLAPNFPNPVREATVFTFQLAATSPLSLKVFDLLGREVATVAEGYFPVGQHRAEWRPDGVAAGLYLYSLEAGGQRMTRRLVVTR